MKKNLGILTAFLLGVLCMGLIALVYAPQLQQISRQLALSPPHEISTEVAISAEQMQGKPVAVRIHELDQYLARLAVRMEVLKIFSAADEPLGSFIKKDQEATRTQMIRVVENMQWWYASVGVVPELTQDSAASSPDQPKLAYN